MRGRNLPHGLVRRELGLDVEQAEPRRRTGWPFEPQRIAHAPAEDLVAAAEAEHMAAAAAMGEDIDIPALLP